MTVAAVPSSMATRYRQTKVAKPDNAPARNGLTASRPRKLVPEGDGSIAPAIPANGTVGSATIIL
jgi:hypothetical protein